jgi:hypothetical protein
MKKFSEWYSSRLQEENFPPTRAHNWVDPNPLKITDDIKIGDQVSWLNKGKEFQGEILKFKSNGQAVVFTAAHEKDNPTATGTREIPVVMLNKIGSPNFSEPTQKIAGDWKSNR